MTRRIFVLIASFALLVRAHAQQTAPASASSAADIEPLIVDDGKHQGEVDLKLDLDSNGSVANATPSSSGDLGTAAIFFTKMFRHPDQRGASSLQQRVIFLRGHDVETVPPVYPPIARSAHVSGTVRMVAAVAPDGHVTDVTVISGPPLLINNASASLLHWIFPPVDQAGSPVPYHAVVDINFASL